MKHKLLYYFNFIFILLPYLEYHFTTDVSLKMSIKKNIIKQIQIHCSIR